MWLFKSRADKTSVSMLLTALDQLDPLFSDYLVWPKIKASVRSGIRSNSRAATQALADLNRTVHGVCLTAVANSLEKDLASGRNHVYRGMLSGIGIEKRRLFHKVLHALVAEGEGSQEQVFFRIATLNSAIEEVG